MGRAAQTTSARHPLRHPNRFESTLAIAEIELRVAACEYAECREDPLGVDAVRAKLCGARLREAAERYTAVKNGATLWKLSS